MRRLILSFVHNCVAHPLLFWTGSCRVAVALHDLTSRLAFDDACVVCGEPVELGSRNSKVGLQPEFVGWDRSASGGSAAFRHVVFRRHRACRLPGDFSGTVPAGDP